MESKIKETRWTEEKERKKEAITFRQVKFDGFINLQS